MKVRGGFPLGADLGGGERFDVTAFRNLAMLLSRGCPSRDVCVGGLVVNQEVL
jgi:hypothetical protein